jgi:probable HAF family extracellular repeat protein
LIGISAGLLVISVAGPAAAAPSAAGSAGSIRIREIHLTVPAGNIAGVQAISPSGVMLGARTDANGRSQTVLWPRPHHPIDLNVVPGRTITVNNVGDVLGADILPYSGFLWRKGQPTSTSIEYPSNIVSPIGLNDHDQVIGTLDPLDGGTTQGFLWQHGVFTLLPAPAGLNSYPVDINNHGEVVGLFASADFSVRRGFIWRHGVVTELGTFDGVGTTPRAINERGQVIGLSGSDTGLIPFLWQNGTLTNLLAGHPGQSGTVDDINDAGMAVGTVDFRPVIWRGNTMTDIGTPGRIAYASYVNSRGDVIGTSYSAATPDMSTGRVFLWRDGRTAFLSEPSGDSDNGPGVGGIDDQGVVVAAIPVPDPGEGHQKIFATR